MAAFNLTASIARAEERMARAPKSQGAANELLAIAALPDEVRASLFNLDLGESQCVSAEVVAFYAFNHGSIRALSFASALPMAALIGAEALTGWRPKSLGLLRAVIGYRGRET